MCAMVNDKVPQEANDEVGYDYEFLPSLDNKHMCPICLLALRDPVQTQCGHRFCNPCILRCIRIKPSCPVDQSPLNENQLFQDKYAHREVLDLLAKCPNKGCDFTAELRNIKLHADSCPLKRVQCKNDCGISLLKRDLVRHEDNDCPRRLVICHNCQTNYPADCEKLHNHVTTECLNAPIKCVFEKVGCLHQLPRRDIKDHMEKSTQIHLQFLLAAIVRMQSHSNKLDKEIEELVARLQNISEVESVDEEENQAVNLTKKHTDDNDAFENEFDEIDIAKMENKKRQQLEEMGAAYDAAGASPTTPTELIANYNETSEKIVSIDHHVRELMAKMETQIMQMKDFSVRLSSVEDKIGTQQLRCCNGLYFWRIKNYARLRQAAKTGEQLVLHSPGFYTSPQGYRMCIRVNLDGVETAQGTHLSLFAHLMKGDFDDLLPWPFKGVITLTVINQRDNPEERSHVSETLIARDPLQAFMRPALERNQKGYGYIDFFPLLMLESEGFIRHDTLVIKAQVVVHIPSMMTQQNLQWPPQQETNTLK